MSELNLKEWQIKLIKDIEDGKVTIVARQQMNAISMNGLTKEELPALVILIVESLSVEKAITFQVSGSVSFSVTRNRKHEIIFEIFVDGTTYARTIVDETIMSTDDLEIRMEKWIQNNLFSRYARESMK